MNNVAIIGIDLAKRVFHAHGAHIDGSVAFRKRLIRAQMLPFLSTQPRCVVVMEACARLMNGAARSSSSDVRLIPPSYVKPYAKRQKNDTADTEAIAEAGSRPTMRFVAVKTEEQQPRSMVFRTRDLLVRQRDATDQRPARPPRRARSRCAARTGSPEVSGQSTGRDRCRNSAAGSRYRPDLPRADRTAERQSCRSRKNASSRSSIRRRNTPLADDAGHRPDHSHGWWRYSHHLCRRFKRGRDFAAWLGLVPVQHSTGGKQRLGRTSKTAMAVIRWASRRGARPGSWLSRMMDRKPLILVAEALANKMARGIRRGGHVRRS